MRKAILWVLIALMALQGFAFAETTAAEAMNGMGAVRAADGLYLEIPSGTGEMLVKLPNDGSAPLCMDRADSIDDLMNYGGGVVYLKTSNGASAIMSCAGTSISTLYSFGASSAENLTFYDGKLMVLMGGLLHSIEPATGLCLRLSGAQMLDYVVGNGCAYYLSGGDQMEYTAQLSEGETAQTQAGCIYRLDLNSGETDLLLKSGGEDLKILGYNLYFHNLADAYAVRIGETASLRGRVYSLDSQLKTLNSECTEPDTDFWPMEAGVVAWYNGALNLETAAGLLALYAPENGASVVSDGTSLFVWEPGKQVLTEVLTNGTANAIYTGNLLQATDAATIPQATATPAPTDEPQSDEAAVANNDWFTNFMNNKEAAQSGTSSSSTFGSSSGSYPQATPIGTTPTPVPLATAVPVTGGSSSGSTSGSSSSGSSSSSSTYSVSINYLKTTGDVHLRSSYSRNSNSKGVIPAGTVIECLGTAAKDSGNNTWYRVEYNGMKGWVSAGYAKKTSYSSSSSSSSSNDVPTGTSTSVSAKYIRIVGGKVNLRSSASKTSTSKGTVPNGAVCTSLGTAKTDSRGVKWYKVEYNGKTGWVSSAYAEPTNSASSSGGSSTASGVKIVGGDCSIRAKANKESTRVGVIKEGKTATYLGSSSKDSRGVVWYKISYNGVTGWVSSRYADLYD